MRFLPAVSFSGVSAAQFGGQVDTDRGWLPLEAEQKGLVRVPSKSAFQRIWRLLKRAECEHDVVCVLFYSNRELIQACQDFIQTVLKQLNVYGFQEC